VLGTDHPAVGKVLAQYWNFSDAMQNAIARHHEPDLLSGDRVAAIVHVSDAIAHGMDFAEDPEDMVPPLSMGVWNALAIDKDMACKIFRETELRFEATQMSLAA
jgi:HD-like signal output (HDOD) protein